MRQNLEQAQLPELRTSSESQEALDENSYLLWTMEGYGKQGGCVELRLKRYSLIKSTPCHHLFQTPLWS